jgi:ABC-type cobalamin/Fe3+-siderophores transport system ATPase subunit
VSAILTTENLRFAYNGSEVLRGISLDIAPGQITGIVGPNGSGKSTLIKLMAGIERPKTGRVLLEGKDLRTIGRKKAALLVSVVPQEVHVHFPFSVAEFVMMGRHPYSGFSPFETQEDREAVAWALAETGTESLAKRSLLSLSGGEKQRAVLASALAQGAPLMLLDEPTASLDLRYQTQIPAILARMCKERGLTVVWVTHDLNLGAQYCDRMVFLNHGEIAADGPPEQVCTAKVVSEQYGVDVWAGTNESTGTPFVLPRGGK